MKISDLEIGQLVLHLAFVIVTILMVVNANVGIGG